MKLQFLLVACVCLIGYGTWAQSPRIHPDPAYSQGGGTASPILQSACLGDATAPSADLKWKPVLKHVQPKPFRPRVPGYEAIQQMKAEKYLLKQASKTAQVDESASASSVTPVVATNFLGNLNDGSSPLDNNIAISDGGIIVSVANGTIEIDNENGTNLYYNSISTLLNDPLVTNICDPAVIYDKRADRFIFFVQECSGSANNSYIMLLFSKTNNPATGGWWKYRFTGNPLNDNSWFDYPKIAVSNNELYVTGNLFYTSGNYNQSVIYTFDKNTAYTGGTVNYQYWYNIDGNPFTILPVGDGQGNSYTPGCYFVATTSSGASSIDFYDLTADMGNNPSLNYYTVSTDAYSPAADSDQLGTSCKLDNGDCRALSGFYLNGTIHFVFHSDIGNGWNGINYNRLNVANRTNNSITFGSQGNFDYSYPAVASFSSSLNDPSVMIGFGRASSAIYPQVRVVNCDASLNFSGSVLVKGSDSYASYTSSSSERWGDYTGMTRRHNAATPTVWMNGMYADGNNLWNTWIAEIEGGAVGVEETAPAQDHLTVYPNPASAAYTLDFELPKAMPLHITLTDAQGRLVQDLYQGNGHVGKNSFTFNRGPLADGIYFLQISSNENIIQHEKIVVAR